MEARKIGIKSVHPQNDPAKGLSHDLCKNTGRNQIGTTSKARSASASSQFKMTVLPVVTGFLYRLPTQTIIRQKVYCSCTSTTTSIDLLKSSDRYNVQTNQRQKVLRKKKSKHRIGERKGRTEKRTKDLRWRQAFQQTHVFTLKEEVLAVVDDIVLGVFDPHPPRLRRPMQALVPDEVGCEGETDAQDGPRDRLARGVEEEDGEGVGAALDFWTNGRMAEHVTCGERGRTS